MSAVAERAEVATGTAYVHYGSKEELVCATYVETKLELGETLICEVDADAEPSRRYGQLLTAAYRHLSEDPARAAFLTQIEVSPYRAKAATLLADHGDPLSREAAREDLAALLIELPLDVVYAMSIGLIVRLVAGGIALDPDELATIVEATWRAITR